MSIGSVMPSSHLILCRPLLLLTPIPPSIRVFSNESTLHMRWPNYWSFSFSIIPSKEHPGLISFRMDQLDLLAVQGTLKNLLQYHISKAITKKKKKSSSLSNGFCIMSLSLRGSSFIYTGPFQLIFRCTLKAVHSQTSNMESDSLLQVSFHET